VAASSAYASSAERSLRTGESVTVAGTTATLQSVERGRDARSMRTTAVLRLSGDRADGTVIRPGLRFFTARQSAVAVPAVLSGFRGDVYASVLAVRSDGSGARVRLAVNPLVGWIWAGGALMVLGGLAGLPRPRRRRQQPAPEPRTVVAA
jgi:cytochrome c-type biogenesis protein CcmF